MATKKTVRNQGELLKEAIDLIVTKLEKDELPFNSEFYSSSLENALSFLQTCIEEKVEYWEEAIRVLDNLYGAFDELSAMRLEVPGAGQVTNPKRGRRR